MTMTMADLVPMMFAFVLVAVAAVSALLYLAEPEDKPHPDAPKPVEPECWCEYVDVAVGRMLAVPHPECPEHTMELLAAMTYRRHTMEQQAGIDAVRTHWAHEGCSCGCGDAA